VGRRDRGLHAPGAAAGRHRGAARRLHRLVATATANAEAQAALTGSRPPGPLR
jgi:hypothetical protein